MGKKRKKNCALEIGWCSRMRSPLSKGLKLTLFPICGLGLICIVLIIHILFWISSHGWGVGRVFGLVFVLFPFVHDPCTLGFFFFFFLIFASY